MGDSAILSHSLCEDENTALGYNNDSYGTKVVNFHIHSFIFALNVSVLCVGLVFFLYKLTKSMGSAIGDGTDNCARVTVQSINGIYL